MDFRTCPACQASVLEEDAADCPFCGASMSGKPQPKPKAPSKAPASKGAAGGSTPAGSKPAPAPPAKRPQTRRPEKAEAAPSGEEDPFDVDTSAVRRAVKLAPRRTKTRTLEIVCPMCETPGFLNPADAGKDVHCANAECMVPVFKSPLPVKEEPTVEEVKSNKVLYIGGTVAAMLLFGAVGWIVFGEEEEEVVDAGPVMERFDATKVELPKNVAVQRVQAPPASLAEIRKRSLDQVIERAQEVSRSAMGEQRQNPADGHQLAAETLAAAGDLTRARDQIRRLQTLGRSTPYFQIQPLVETAWRQLERGETDAALASATTALERAKNLPKTIRKTHDAAISLGAVLVALDRREEVEKLIREQQDPGPRGEVSVLWRACLDSRTFSLDLEARRPYHVAIPEPMRQGIVASLVARGREEQALAFASAAPNVASRDACRAAWAGRLMLAQPQQAVEKVTQTLENDVSPAGQARAWGAVAAHLLASKEESAARTALQNAVAALEKISSRSPVALPGMKDLYDSEGKPYVGLPNPSPWRSAALAAGDVALIQLDLGQTEEAWSSVEKAMQFARVMAPSPSATQALYDGVQKQESATRARLNEVLKLGNDEPRLRIAYNRYRRQAAKLNSEEAAPRLALQVEILQAAAERGLREQVWNFAVEQSRLSDAKAKEPFLASSLPSWILSLAHAHGEDDLAGKVASDLADEELKQDPVHRLYSEAGRLVSEGKLGEALERIRTAYRGDVARRHPDRLDRAVFQLTARVQRDRPIAEAFEFVRNLNDPVTKGDALQLLAAGSVASGTAADLWRIASETRDLTPIDHASLYRGFVAAIPGKAASPQAPKTTAAN